MVRPAHLGGAEKSDGVRGLAVPVVEERDEAVGIPFYMMRIFHQDVFASDPNDPGGGVVFHINDSTRHFFVFSATFIQYQLNRGTFHKIMDNKTMRLDPKNNLVVHYLVKPLWLRLS